ncbi:uncharacterized protein LOC143181889 [Calliopsis andreniformis]|uniref:uncharacterized protein LOC143181889 n=1 Tax=Calliopsis andreniformis TaxID=337506 RepID=UPI003FCE2A37
MTSARDTPKVVRCEFWTHRLCRAISRDAAKNIPRNPSRQIRKLCAYDRVARTPRGNSSRPSRTRDATRNFVHCGVTCVGRPIAILSGHEYLCAESAPAAARCSASPRPRSVGEGHVAADQLRTGSWVMDGWMEGFYSYISPLSEEDRSTSCRSMEAITRSYPLPQPRDLPCFSGPDVYRERLSMRVAEMVDCEGKRDVETDTEMKQESRTRLEEESVMSRKFQLPRGIEVVAALGTQRSEAKALEIKNSNII